MKTLKVLLSILTCVHLLLISGCTENKTTQPDIIPKRVTGYLWLHVVDSNGDPISGAEVIVEVRSQADPGPYLLTDTSITNGVAYMGAALGCNLTTRDMGLIDIYTTLGEDISDTTRLYYDEGEKMKRVIWLPISKGN